MSRCCAELKDAGVAVFNLPSEVTTTFRNVYPLSNPDVRVQRVDARAGPIAAAALPDVRARIWQIGPLTKSDVELAMIGRCAGLGGLVGMDVQGLTRDVVDGQVRASGAAVQMDDLRDLDVLKADEEEILTYTGANSVEAAVAKVRAAGVREVLITRGSEGAVIYGGGAPLVDRRRPAAPDGGRDRLRRHLSRGLPGAPDHRPMTCASAAPSRPPPRRSTSRGSGRFAAPPPRLRSDGRPRATVLSELAPVLCLERDRPS